MTPKEFVIQNKDEEITLAENRAIISVKKASDPSITVNTFIENDGETITIRTEEVSRRS